MATQNSSISVADYNSIQTAISNIYGDNYGTHGTQGESDPSYGWGQQVSSSPVVGATGAGNPSSVASKVSVADMQKLFYDLVNAYYKIYGVDYSSNLTVPTSDNSISAAIISQYSAVASTISANKFSLYTGNTSVTSTTKTLSPGWNVSASQTITVTFASYDRARYFFNNGGTIQLYSSISGGTTGSATTKDFSWNSIFNSVGIIYIGAQGITSSNSGTTATINNYGFYNFPTSDTPLVICTTPNAGGTSPTDTGGAYNPNTGGLIYAPNQYQINGSWNSSNNTFTFNISWQDLATSTNTQYVGQGQGTDTPIQGTIGSTIQLATPSTYIIVGPNAGSRFVLISPPGVGAGTIFTAANDRSSSATPILISPQTLSVAPTAEAQFSQQFTASGGTAPYAITLVSSSFPAGISYNQSTATLSGVATGAPTSGWAFTLQATDAQGFIGTQSYSSYVIEPTISIGFSGSSSTTVYSNYQGFISATGGAGTYTYAIKGNVPPSSAYQYLPSGISFGGNIISGTPTQAGNFNFTITATDSYGFYGEQNYNLSVAGPTITVTPNGPGSYTGEVGLNSSYTLSCSSSGGSGTITWSTAPSSPPYGTSDGLPPGLTLNSSNGTVSGTCNTEGHWAWSMRATDSNGFYGQNIYSLIVANNRTRQVYSYSSPGSYSFSVPSGATVVNLIAIGGGGGGATATSTVVRLAFLGSRTVWTPGGGGGGGGYYQSGDFSVSPGDYFTFSIGSGGGAGAAGGTTTVNWYNSSGGLKAQISAGGGNPGSGTSGGGAGSGGGNGGNGVAASGSYVGNPGGAGSSLALGPLSAEVGGGGGGGTSGSGFTSSGGPGGGGFGGSSGSNGGNGTGGIGGGGGGGGQTSGGSGGSGGVYFFA